MSLEPLAYSAEVVEVKAVAEHEDGMAG